MFGAAWAWAAERELWQDGTPQDEAEAVAIRGFRLLPLGELGRNGAIDLHPKALLGAGASSNPLWRPEGGDGDGFLRAAAGLEGRARIADHLRLEVEGVADAVRYADTPGRSFLGGEARVRARHDGDSTSLGLEVAWQRDAEPVAPLPEQVRRDRIDAGVRYTAESRRLRVVADASARITDYLEDASFFTSDERDAIELAARASLARLGGSGSLLAADGAVRDVCYRSSSTSNPFRQATLVLRWVHRLGDRTQADLRLGYSLRRHGDDTGGLPANDDQTVHGPVGSAGLLWSWESGSWLVLRASHALTDGTAGSSNASTLDAFTAEQRLRLADRLGWRNSLWLAKRVDSGSDAGLDPLEVTSLMGRSGIEHYLRDGVGLRVWLMLQSSETSTDVRTTGVTGALELAMAL